MKGHVKITGGPEHADIRETLRWIRKVVPDKRDRQRVEEELFVSLIRAGRLAVHDGDAPPAPAAVHDENRLWRHGMEPAPADDPEAGHTAID